MIKSEINVKVHGQSNEFDNVPRGCNGLEVGFGDPSIPMMAKGGRGYFSGLILTKRPLVNNIIVSGVVEKTGSDPRLCQER